MPLILRDDDWVEIPSCRYRVGLEDHEIDRLAEMSAALAIQGWEEIAHDYGEELNDAVGLDYGRPAWVRRKLTQLCYAYDVEIPAFAIAKRPVTNGQFRRFLAEVGGSEPESWKEPDQFDLTDDQPVRGVSWSRAVEFAAWAGGRLPFEAEWERAGRGIERRLFPWGDDPSHAGRWTGRMLHMSFHPPDRKASATSESIEGMVTGHHLHREWCADVRPNPSMLGAFATQLPRLEERWGRATRGASPHMHPVPFPPHTDIMSTCASRTSDLTEGSAYGSCIGFRIVRADGRPMPAEPSVGPWPSVAPRVVEFEEVVVRPVLESLRGQLEFHRAHVVNDDTPEGAFDSAEDKMKPPREWPISELIGWLWGIHPRHAEKCLPDRPLGGDKLLALSMESFRRVLPEHGVFVWQAKYRLGPEATTVHAHPVVAFRMNHDRKRHMFHARFVPGERDTRIEHVTPEMVRRSILEMFDYYENHADADRPAPPPAGWVETTAANDWWVDWWTAR